MRQPRALCLGVLLLLSPALASPVSWRSYRMLSSTERESAAAYWLVARGVSGRLGITRNVTYSLSFRGGRVRLGGETLGPGCSSGKLGRGDVLLFQDVRRVEFHIPSAGCSGRSP